MTWVGDLVFSIILVGVLLFFIWLFFSPNRNTRLWARKAYIIAMIVSVLIGISINISGIAVRHNAYIQNRDAENRLYYSDQDAAFSGVGDTSSSDADQSNLQFELCAYKHYTGKTVTLEDIQSFLSKQKNSDGSPRTYMNPPGAVSDYVKWYKNLKPSSLVGYGMALSKIMIDYESTHPEAKSKYRGDEFPDETLILDRFPPDIIRALAEKYENPSYQLNLS